MSKDLHEMIKLLLNESFIVVILVWKVMTRKGLPTLHLVLSYVVTCFFFASMYTALPCSQVRQLISNCVIS